MSGDAGGRWDTWKNHTYAVPRRAETHDPMKINFGPFGPVCQGLCVPHNLGSTNLSGSRQHRW